ncbi:MAG: NADH-quinone oxidoreductase subunit L [Sulfolobales archaeon]
MPLAIEWLPIIWAAPFIGAFLSGLVGLVSKRASAYIGSASIGVSAILTIPVILAFIGSGDVVISPRYSWIQLPLHNGILDIDLGVYLDGISLALTAMVAWVSFLIGVYSLSYMKGDYGEHRYWVFFTFFVGSMLLLVMTDNLIMLLIGWEGTSLASYALISHWYRDDEHAWVGDPGRKALGRPMWFTPSHAGVRAIVMTGVPDIGFILGLTSIMLFTSTAYIPDLYRGLAPMMGDLAARGILAGFLFMFTLGALAKSAQFPLHEWLVTAMTGPASVSALIHAATMVKAGVYFMLRFVPIFISASSIAGDLAISQVRDYLAIVGGIGVFTAFMMATMALVARELKLILAFSTASQIGYMFMAASYAGMMHEPGLGIVAGLSHLLSHAVFKASLFLGAGILIHSLGSRYIDHMAGRASKLRVTMISMILASLGLAAIPPFSGFWSKDLAIDAAIESGYISSAVLAIITSLLTAIYTLRMISILYIVSPRDMHGGKAVEGVHGDHGEDPVAYIPYLLLAIATPVMGILWGQAINSFSIASLRGTGLEIPEISYRPDLLGISAAIAIAGSLLAIGLYRRFGLDILAAMRGNPIAVAINRFLYDRWYINSIIYAIFVDGGAKTVRSVGRYFEGGVIDRIYHAVIPKGFSIFSRILRSYQPGVINSYLIVMVLGAIFLILLQLWR